MSWAWHKFAPACLNMTTVLYGESWAISTDGFIESYMKGDMISFQALSKPVHVHLYLIKIVNI